MSEPRKNGRSSSRKLSSDTEGASEHLRLAMEEARRKAVTWTFLHIVVPWFTMLAAILAAWGAWRSDPAPPQDPRIDEVLECVRRTQGKVMILQEQVRKLSGKEGAEREE